jgi:hypothetical protein
MPRLPGHETSLNGGAEQTGDEQSLRIRKLGLEHARTRPSSKDNGRITFGDDRWPGLLARCQTAGIIAMRLIENRRGWSRKKGTWACGEILYALLVLDVPFAEQFTDATARHSPKRLSEGDHPLIGRSVIASVLFRISPQLLKRVGFYYVYIKC